MANRKTTAFYCVIALTALASVALAATVTPPTKPTNTNASANKNKNVPAKPPAPPEMWGVQLPMGAEKIQIYRATVSYRVNVDPEETAKQLLATLGSSGIKVYRSTVGSTVMVFIESETPRTWREIQISGTKGKTQSFIVIAKAHGDVGWRWKRNGKNWDFQ